MWQLAVWVVGWLTLCGLLLVAGDALGAAALGGGTPARRGGGKATLFTTLLTKASRVTGLPACAMDTRRMAM